MFIEAIDADGKHTLIPIHRVIGIDALDGAEEHAVVWFHDTDANDLTLVNNLVTALTFELLVDRLTGHPWRYNEAPR